MAQINQLSVTSGSVSLPNSGSVAIFSNIEDNGNLYIKSSAGTVTPVGNTSGGGGSGSSGTSGTSGAGSSGTGGTSGTSGTGVSGTGGTSGTSGNGTGGTSGTSGTQGATGTNGTSGTQGATGTNGTSGTQGATGTNGTSGTQGATGTGGTSGTSGNGTAGTSGTGGAGTSGTSGINGTSGTGGAGTSGSSGTSGATGTSGTSGAGGGGTSTLYNSVSRYQAYLSGDIEVYLVSSATVNTGLTWSRSGTTLTITHTGHGRSNGDMVIVRNANQDNFNGTITVVDPDNFTLTTTNTGGTSGTAAAYSLGFTVGTPTASALTITAPTGGDVQLLSVLFATGARGGSTTLAVTVPQSATNGAGANTTGQNSFYPIVRVQTISTGAVQGATLTLNTSAPFNVFNFGSMNATLSNLVRLDF